MGLLRTMIIRLALYALSLVVNMAAAVILARRLDPRSYAIYQFDTKRLVYYVLLAVTPISIWLYRSRSRGEAVADGVAVLITPPLAAASLCLAYVVTRNLSGNPLVSIVAAASVAAIVMYNVFSKLLETRRPIRSALARLGVRLTYSASIAVLVHMLGMGLLGAFAGTAFAYIIWVLVAAAWSGLALPEPRRLRVYLSTMARWLRASFYLLPAPAASLLPMFDAAVVYRMSGPEVVAGFFAITSPLQIIAEIAFHAYSYLQSYLLSPGGEHGEKIKAAVRAARMTALLLTPFIVYAAAVGSYYVALISPRYLWAASAAVLAAVAIHVAVARAIVEPILLGSIGSGNEKEEAVIIGRIAVNTGLLPAVVYLAAVSLASLLPGKMAALAGWEAALLLYNSLSLAASTMLLRRLTGVNILGSIAPALLLYPLAEAVLALLLRPRGAPPASFWAVLAAVAPWFIAYYAASLALLLLLDREARAAALLLYRRLLRRASMIRGSW